jgi:hypothetical protein
MALRITVIPAEAGIQQLLGVLRMCSAIGALWVPAFAGTTNASRFAHKLSG